MTKTNTMTYVAIGSTLLMLGAAASGLTFWQLGTTEAASRLGLLSDTSYDVSLAIIAATPASALLLIGLSAAKAFMKKSRCGNTLGSLLSGVAAALSAGATGILVSDEGVYSASARLLAGLLSLGFGLGATGLAYLMASRFFRSADVEGSEALLGANGVKVSGERRPSEIYSALDFGDDPDRIVHSYRTKADGSFEHIKDIDTKIEAEEAQARAIANTP